MPALLTILRERFRAALAAAFGPERAETDPLLRPSGNEKFGDYQANLAMNLAKTLGLKPRDVAQKIVAHLRLDDVCSKVEIAGPGFINLYLNAAFLAQQVQALRQDEYLGVAQVDPPQTVVVDYSGPNVAKEMHVGHLRSTCIGDVLARVLAYTGQKVIRQNHLGDWGTQFGMLIEHLLESGKAQEQESRGSGGPAIGDLNTFYQEAKKRFDSDPDFAAKARQRVVALQGGEAQTLACWRELIDESKRHFNALYRRLGVLLTDADIRAESFYNPMLADVAAELEKAGLAQVSEGALCVFLPEFKAQDGKPLPVLVRKSDGGFLYATTDLAALKYRLKALQAKRIIYVTDARQKQHFAMVFKVAEMAGWSKVEPESEPTPDRTIAALEPHRLGLKHVPFGTVLGEDGKPFKTRSGDTVKLIDLLDEAEKRAAEVLQAKNPELAEAKRKEIAHAVGIGAIKYADLCNDRVKDYVFAWDRMLSFDGNTAPYLQNAYVRIRSIFRKAEGSGQWPMADGQDQSEILLSAPAERALALKLLQFAGTVESVAEALEPHRLCTYLYELAALYHQFYEQCPVLTAPNDGTRNSRLQLSALTARVLKQGLELLGIQTVEQM